MGWRRRRFWQRAKEWLRRWLGTGRGQDMYISAKHLEALQKDEDRQGWEGPRWRTVTELEAMRRG